MDGPLLRFWVRINIDFRDLKTHKHATLKVVKAMVLEMISKRCRFSIMVSVVDNAHYCNCHFLLENSILSDWLLFTNMYHKMLLFVSVKISKLKWIHEMKRWPIKNYVKHQTASKNCKCLIKVMFFKNTTKLPNLHCRFDIMYYISVKLTVKIWSIFVAFLVNTNFNVLILKHLST